MVSKASRVITYCLCVCLVEMLMFALAVFGLMSFFLECATCISIISCGRLYSSELVMHDIFSNKAKDEDSLYN